ncbi:MAG: hypothetical protein ACTSRG_25150 [Candidatus Helarchaeota archaeon]
MENNILRLLFEFDSPYIGYPLYITGNALRHALKTRVNTSIGKFVNVNNLFIPNTYEEFFSLRTIETLLPPNFFNLFSKYEHKKKMQEFYEPHAVTFDIITDTPRQILNIIDKKDLIQLGGWRNKAFGVVHLIDSLEINLDDLKLPSKATHIILLSPIIHIPNFVESYDCRRSVEFFWNNSRRNSITIIAPGQFFRIKRDRDIEKIALKGIRRKFLFGKFGYGEFQVKNWPKEEK